MNAYAPRSSYPGKVAIRHVVEAARASGLDVAGLEVAPDGTIRILEARAMPQQPKSLFEELDAAGRL
jgi:hypothetical protein